MLYEWDEAKCRANIAKHGIDFARVREFEWSSAIAFVDDRDDYGELREIAIGFIGVRLHVLALTRRDGDVIRVIMLRKATAGEARGYAKAQK
jgi:uncharacterized DUF497 family protein